MAQLPSMSSLPAEVQALVVDLVIATVADRAYLPALATVSRTWQHLIERHTFADLRLTQERVADAHDIMKRGRQALVRTVRMHVLLDRYGEDACARVETVEEQQRNNVVFSEAVRGLYRLLASWQGSESAAEEDARGPALALYLDVYSPDDLRPGGDIRRRRHRQLMEALGKDILERRFTSSCLDMDGAAIDELPDLPVISEFHIPPTFNRRLVPSVCCDLACKMSKLKSAKWLLSDRTKDNLPLQRRLRDDFALKLHLLPTSLRYFELGYDSPSPQTPRLPGAQEAAADVLSAELRKLSQRMESFVVTGPSLGPDVFWPVVAESDNVAAALSWPCLKRLVVRPIAQSPEGTWIFSSPDRAFPDAGDDEHEYEDDEDDDDGEGGDEEDEQVMLAAPNDKLADMYYVAAARAAARMPRLANLTIQWNASSPSWLVFSARLSEAPVLWLRGEAPVLSDVVKEAWQAAVGERTGAAELRFRVGESEPLLVGGLGGGTSTRAG